MATRKAVNAAVSEADSPQDGCVFMWRTDETGAVQRAEVEALCGSVEVMAALGWTTEPPKD